MHPYDCVAVVVITKAVVDYVGVFEYLRQHLDRSVMWSTIVVVWETDDHFSNLLQSLGWRVCKMNKSDQLEYTVARADLALIATRNLSGPVVQLQETLLDRGVTSEIVVTGHSMTQLTYPYGTSHGQE